MVCFAALADMHTGTMYTDGACAFPVQSFRNMQYIFVAYIYDLNAILVRAMPSKNDGAMIATFKDILVTLNTTRGYAPTLNVMYNECSKAVEAHIWSHNMDIHLVPPTITVSMRPNTWLLPSKSILFLPSSPQLARTVHSSSRMTFYPRWN